MGTAKKNIGKNSFLVHEFLFFLAPAKDAVQVGSNITAFVKTVVTLPCTMTQNELDLVEWTRMGNDTSSYVLIQHRSMTVVDQKYKDRVSLINGKDLQIKDLKTSDEDTYFCNVSSSAKAGILAPVKLVVLCECDFIHFFFTNILRVRACQVTLFASVHV